MRAKLEIIQDGGTVPVEAVGDAAVWPTLHEGALWDGPGEHWGLRKHLI